MKKLIKITAFILCMGLFLHIFAYETDQEFINPLSNEYNGSLFISYSEVEEEEKEVDKTFFINPKMEIENNSTTSSSPQKIVNKNKVIRFNEYREARE